MDYRIQDLIDIPLFQVLQDRLNEIYSFPSAIIDNDGRVLTATAWQDVCTKFHRVHPECAKACQASDRYIFDHLAEANPAVTYRCPHGLVDNATPIVIGGKHLANYFTGQFFLEPPDLDFFRAQARRYGFEEGAYLDAVRRVPIWTERKLGQYLEFIKGFTEILCGIGLKHLQELESRRVLAENRSALAEMSAFNEQIIQSVEEGVIVYGTDLRYRVWNPYMERLSGLPAAEVLGRLPQEVFPFLEGVGVVDRVRRALQGLASPNVDFPYHLPNGRTGWTSESCAPLYSQSGAVIGAIATIREISEAKRAEEAEQRLRAELAQAQRLDSVGRLAGGIAHDFNNMLSVVFANVDGALEELDPSSPVRADLLEIRGVAERSAALVRQLLAFARRQPAAPRAIDLNVAVPGVMSMLRRLVGENVDVVWRPSETPCVVSIDPSQLDQILANLCVNARDAISGAGTITLRTQAAAAPRAARTPVPPREYVLLEVSDTGTGMPAEVQDRIFEPFFSTKPVGRGAGLGLATVHGIVHQNDGFIEMDSAPGRGTSFAIYLPRTGAPPSEPVQGASPRSRPSRGAETVLLVEDEGSVRRVALRALERLGYRVLEAATPGDALRLAGEHDGHIDLLVTDLVMPGMDGVALAERLTSARPGLKRLFVSGYPAPLASERGTLHEGLNYLPKPFSPDQLAERVRAALDGP